MNVDLSLDYGILYMFIKYFCNVEIMKLRLAVVRNPMSAIFHFPPVILPTHLAKL